MTYTLTGLTDEEARLFKLWVSMSHLYGGLDMRGIVSKILDAEHTKSRELEEAITGLVAAYPREQHHPVHPEVWQKVYTAVDSLVRWRGEKVTT